MASYKLLLHRNYSLSMSFNTPSENAFGEIQLLIFLLRRVHGLILHTSQQWRRIQADPPGFPNVF